MLRTKWRETNEQQNFWPDSAFAWLLLSFSPFPARHSDHKVSIYENSRDVKGLADAEDTVLDAKVDESVPAAPHDGVVHYGRLREIQIQN